MEVVKYVLKNATDKQKRFGNIKSARKTTTKHQL